MNANDVNDYGSLCAEMYEHLHENAPVDELGFYRSYAEKGKRILEALCGSGRFLIPLLDAGYDIEGIDSSFPMLAKLKAKRPNAQTTCSDIASFETREKFDYVFITSGSVSLFTDDESLKSALATVRNVLRPRGLFVFAVDTTANAEPDDEDYRITAEAPIDDSRTLILKTKNRFDAQTRTQFSPGIYELFENGELVETEHMDFQTHLYSFGEIDGTLDEAGFKVNAVYSSFKKDPATGDGDEMLLYECTLKD